MSPLKKSKVEGRKSKAPASISSFLALAFDPRLSTFD